VSPPYASIYSTMHIYLQPTPNETDMSEAHAKKTPDDRRIEMIDEELREGETVHWVGVAILVRLIPHHLPLLVATGGMTILSAYYLTGGPKIAVPVLLHGIPLAVYFGLLYSVIALVLISIVWGRFSNRRRPVYVVTNQRAILFRGLYRMQPKDTAWHEIGAVIADKLEGDVCDLTLQSVSPPKERRNIVFVAAPNASGLIGALQTCFSALDLVVRWEPSHLDITANSGVLNSPDGVPDNSDDESDTIRTA
jgi:hypothetical protein